MRNQLKNFLHEKAERIIIKDGAPSLSGMREGVPEIRRIRNKGLYLCVKEKGSLRSIKFENGIN